MRMSWGLKRSEHSGQLMFTLDSEISIRRYWRRQSMQERCGQVIMSGKDSLEWRKRHNGHSRRSAPTPPPTLEDEEDVKEEGLEAVEVEAAADRTAPEPVEEYKEEFLSLHISEWMLSMLAIPSTPPNPTVPGWCSSLDLRRPDFDSRPLRLKRETRERRLFFGAFFTDGKVTADVDCMSLSEPLSPSPPPRGWCFCRLISPGEGEGCPRGQPELGTLPFTCAGRSRRETGLREGVRWWIGERGGGPGWQGRAPEGPSVFKT